MHLRGAILRCGLQLLKRRQERRLLSLSQVVDQIVKSPLPDVRIPNVSIPEYIWEKIDLWPDKVAYECAITGRRYRYAEARELCRRFAASLHRIGLQPGDCLAIIMSNNIEWPIVLFGAIEAGLVVTTINPTYTAEEMSRQLKDSQPRFIVTVSSIHSTVQKALDSTNKKEGPFIIIAPEIEKSHIPEHAIDLMHMLRDGIDTSHIRFNGSVEDTAILPYSSGTTGLPKGVMLHHRNVVSNVQQTHVPELAVYEMATDSYQDVTPAVLPFFHAYALCYELMAAIFCGAKLVILPRFEPATFLETLEKHQVTVLHSVPPMVLFLASHPNVKPKHIQNLRYIVCGAAPIGPKDIERFFKRAGPDTRLIQAYGMTETSPIITISPKNNTNYESVGIPIPNTEVKVRDLETGKALAAGETGEICTRGPQNMKGYFKLPEATAQMIDSEGWLHTGDVGYYDEKGYFYVVDRFKELIKVQGFQVAPAELEEILRAHPDVQDAAVVGVPDERKGEIPKAFVVTKASNITEESIKKFVEKKVAKYKRLEGGVEFVTSIPKTQSGKILRKVLREFK
ncbi:uncharacterized protein [Periplaneta americana]|uniref:uncharacterized protein n=1 Tax=Periplaneta americana TaxID=6978 RepID=UPI0037E6FE07